MFCVRFGRYAPVGFLILTLGLVPAACSKNPASGGTGKETPFQPVDTVLLKNGGVIQGKVIRETPAEVEVRWQDGIVTFKRDEIVGIKINDSQSQGEKGIVLPEQKDREDGSQDPASYPRVYLRNGTVKKNVAISKKGADYVIGEKIEGGGVIEYDFTGGEIERVALWPPVRPSDSSPFQELAKNYSSFRRYEKPHYLIISDDGAMDLDFYLKSLERFYNEFLIYFLDFVRPDYKPRALEAVIFGQQATFQQLLESAGFPKNAMILGFFTPETQILYLYNIKSMEMVNRYLNRSEDVEEKIKDRIEQISKYRGDDIEKTRVMGEGERIVEFLEKNRLKVEAEARAETVKTIRHEGAHQLLYEFDIYAKNSRQGAWLVEGLASFCEPPVIGEVHDTRLMELKFELEKHHLMPLEYLLSFSAGSDIHRLEPAYASLGYAQSWAFVYFLMSGSYRDGFLQYVREVSRQGEDFDAEQDIALLEKHLGHTVAEMEKEFGPFVDKMIKDEVEDVKYEDFRLRMIMAQ
ncbi:MAG: DUF1570 domain-containing protein [Candidatus Omnitrophica bacterium]|nr:DUF1570 domain-containing protein [Candidatus Omnitrophota bacterium]